jgi:hypothetical protein
MALFHLHDDRFRFAGGGGFAIARMFRRMRAIFRLMHHAIVVAKMRRLQSELMFHRGFESDGSAGQDAGRYPQRPLILGDKWDF